MGVADENCRPAGGARARHVMSCARCLHGGCVGTPTDRQAVVHADGPYVLGHSLLGLQVIEGVTHTLDGTGTTIDPPTTFAHAAQNPK